MSNRAQQVRNAQAHYRAKLRELAQDRPVHLAYIDRMLAAGYNGADDVPRPVGVSCRVADAVWEDVTWITQPIDEDYSGGLAGYQHAYRDERSRLAAQNAKARRRRDDYREDRIQELLHISG